MEKGRWKKQARKVLSLLVLFFCVIMAKGFSEREQYFIPVDGQLIEVTREVYIAYYQAERRERYLKEKEQKYGVLYMGILEEKYLEKCSYLRAWEEETGVQAVGKVYLESLMNRLEEKEKDVFRLYCVEGFSLRETADKMGIHYLKARRMLKHIWEKLKSQL